MPNFAPLTPERLAEVKARFHANFEDFQEIGASVAIWQGETELLNLSHGFRDRKRTVTWTADTLVPIWSCTKGPASAALLAALQDTGHSLHTPVASIWKEFGQSGKESLTFEQLLSHQAGLAALDVPPPVTDYRAVVAALENQTPLWTAGHGYHPRTFGFLLEECVRRLTGAASLGTYWRQSLAEPLGLDAWIGLPPSEHHRVAPIYPGRLGSSLPDDHAFFEAMADPASPPVRAFRSPKGLHAVAEMNDPAVWQADYPAMGGLASARGLAAFYAFLASGATCAGESFFNASMLEQMETTVIQGWDRTFLRETAFAAGFMKDPVDDAGNKTRQIFGPNKRAFGHPGAGGSLAFADPETGIGFAYVMNQMERSVFPTERSLGLVRALYGTSP